MQKIVQVQRYDDDSDIVIVELAGSNTILLSLASKMSNPLFAEIKKLALPKTDGERVYWTNGASLTVDEIFSMIQSDGSSETD